MHISTTVENFNVQLTPFQHADAEIDEMNETGSTETVERSIRIIERSIVKMHPSAQESQTRLLTVYKTALDEFKKKRS